ncbi:hypothetical protein EDB87DRAFT_1032879 [Lactarius vividus]|nr:hypothetical protein EDB87DRAFT_1032879 [Lactarius vividus]
MACQPSSPASHSPNAQLPTQTLVPTTFPRTLQSTYVQTAFQANLHEAFEEIRTKDPFMDPLYPPRYIGPQARKRQFKEMKDREEAKAGDHRKTPRRGKTTATAPNSSKAKDTDLPPSFPPPINWRFPCNCSRPFSPDSYGSVG